MTLPDHYKWLLNEPRIPMLAEALKYYGLKEAPGSADNPTILKWAHDFGIDWYTHDSISWCSLYMGQVAKDAGYMPPNKNKLLAAVSWMDWGVRVQSTPMLGDVMVFNRPGGHHVGLYIGEDAQSYLTFGGNVSDAVGFAKIAKNRFLGARMGKAGEIFPNRRQINIADSGTPLSQNEA